MNESKATRYRRLRRRAGLGAAAAWVLLLAGLAAGGGARSAADAAAAQAAALPLPEAVQFLLAVAGCAGALGLVAGLLAAPAAWYGQFVLERRFEMSRQLPGAWLRESLQVAAAYLLLWTVAVVLLYAAMRWLPAWWWLAPALAFAVAVVAAGHLAPGFTAVSGRLLRPLAPSPLRRRLEVLMARAGVPRMEIQEWRTGGARPRPGAVLVGFGPARRVLLTDALLADYSEDEIEVVLAHELGHCVHRDLWRSVVLETAAWTLACAAAAWVLQRYTPALGLGAAWDVAGLPATALTVGGVLLLLRPVSNWLSRRWERRADRYAVALTGNPAALASGLRRLAGQSLAEERPAPLIEWWCHSHPPLAARLAACAAAAQAGGNPAGRGS